jgi:hypothetical protein
MERPLCDPEGGAPRVALSRPSSLPFLSSRDSSQRRLQEDGSVIGRARPTRARRNQPRDSTSETVREG